MLLNFDEPVLTKLISVDTYLNPKMRVDEACRTLREKKLSQRVTYLYVVDDKMHLLGLLPIRKLLFSPVDVTVESLMETNIVHIDSKATMKEAYKLFHEHKLLALPVVENGKLIGIIEAVSEDAEKNSPHISRDVSSDLFQFVGLSVESAKMKTVKLEFFLRMPWLLCNIIAGILCAVVASQFDVLLSTSVIIAMFIPLVLTLSESISMQSMTIVLQHLHKPKVPWSTIFKRLFKDLRTSLVIGIVSALIVGTVSMLFPESFLTATMSIMLSILLAMLVSALFGVLFPSILHAFRLDPRLAAGPVILMFVDVTATTLYLFTSYLVI